MKEIARIIRYSWSLKRYYWLTAAFVVTIAVLNQAQPFLFKYIVDGLVQHRNASYLAVLVGLILAVNVITTLLSNIQGYYGDILGSKLNTLLSTRYYDHILQLPLEYYDNQIAGRVTSRLERSIVTISSLMNAFANNFIGFFLTSIFTLVILAYYAWPIALLLALLFPFYIWLTALSSRGWQAKQEHINADTDRNNGRFVESINQIRVVKSFVQELVESRLFADTRKRIEAQTKVQSRQWHQYDNLRRVGLSFVFFLIYAYIVWKTYQGHYSLGQFTLLIQLTTQAQIPLFASSFIVDNLQRARAGSKDFFEVMDTVPSIVDAPGAGQLQVSLGLVEFRQASFAYTNGATVLNHVSFIMEPGTRVALVGESGEGKTTISNLLLRFYHLSDGTITIDNTDITTVTQASLRQAIGVVFQEPALFSGTVRENISYGSPKATPADIEKAATAANASGFIAKLPNGYDTEIGERGVKLSGGQKQRLAIARAILKNPPILILDEATSSLDSRAEHEVQQALDTLMANRTTLIIAHRLSTIAAVDKIIGLQGGKIVEEGTPQELAQGNGIYAELLKLQSSSSKAALKRFEIG